MFDYHKVNFLIKTIFHESSYLKRSKILTYSSQNVRAVVLANISYGFGGAQGYIYQFL